MLKAKRIILAHSIGSAIPDTLASPSSFKPKFGNVEDGSATPSLCLERYQNHNAPETNDSILSVYPKGKLEEGLGDYDYL